MVLNAFIVISQVWYRVIQIVINRDDVQGYAAKTVFEVRLRQSLHCVSPLGGLLHYRVGQHSLIISWPFTYEYIHKLLIRSGKVVKKTQKKLSYQQQEISHFKICM